MREQELPELENIIVSAEGEKGEKGEKCYKEIKNKKKRSKSNVIR